MTKDFDIKADKPSWPLSSYGPAKHEKNLLPTLDESPEELRLKAATAMRNGNINEYVRVPHCILSNNFLIIGRKLQHEQNVFANAEQIFANVRNDMKSAFEAAKRQSLGAETPNSTSAFPVSGTASASGAATAFPAGQPSAFGAQSPGSTSAFGQQPGSSAFGAPAFGASAFGQSPSFGQPSIAKPPFGGAAANSGGFSAFAGPGPSAFATAGTTSPTTTSGSVFGQSAFSGSGGGAQPAQSAFGTTNSNSAFARPSAFGSTSGSAFGQASPFNVTNNAPSAFGQPPSASAFAQTPTATSTSPTTAPFGAPTPNTTAFGQPTSVFGQPTAASAFGRSNSAFGAAVPAQQSAFGQAVSPVSQGSSTGAPKPHVESTAPDFANAKSTYRPGLDPYDTLLPPDYSSLLPDSVREAFAAPRFSWDNVPDWIPPMDMR
jgi:nucleoporin NUP42